MSCQQAPGLNKNKNAGACWPESGNSHRQSLCLTGGSRGSQSCIDEVGRRLQDALFSKYGPGGIPCPPPQQLSCSASKTLPQQPTTCPQRSMCADQPQAPPPCNMEPSCPAQAMCAESSAPPAFPNNQPIGNNKCPNRSSISPGPITEASCSKSCLEMRLPQLVPLPLPKPTYAPQCPHNPPQLLNKNCMAPQQQQLPPQNTGGCFSKKPPIPPSQQSQGLRGSNQQPEILNNPNKVSFSSFQPPRFSNTTPSDPPQAGAQKKSTITAPQLLPPVPDTSRSSLKPSAKVSVVNLPIATCPNQQQRLSQVTPSQQRLSQVTPSQQRLSCPSQQRLSQVTPSQQRLSQVTPSQQRLSQVTPSQQRLSQVTPSQQRLSQVTPSQQRLSCPSQQRLSQVASTTTPCASLKPVPSKVNCTVNPCVSVNAVPSTAHCAVDPCASLKAVVASKANCTASVRASKADGICQPPPEQPPVDEVIPQCPQAQPDESTPPPCSVLEKKPSQTVEEAAKKVNGKIVSGNSERFKSTEPPPNKPLIAMHEEDEGCDCPGYSPSIGLFDVSWLQFFQFLQADGGWSCHDERVEVKSVPSEHHF